MNAADKPKEFVALWTAHSRGVYAYILSLVGNWADAEDIFQETSTTLWEKIGEFQPDKDFGAWARGIAHFKALSHWQARRHLEHFDEHFFASLQADYEEIGGELETSFVALQDCLKKLSVRDRALIETRYHGNRTPKQVADKVGRTVVSIYKALRRIHESLFECIQRQLARERRS
jgi:RNA polymerase sigma-70 factor (ECF subfamily)